MGDTRRVAKYREKREKRTSYTTDLNNVTFHGCVVVAVNVLTFPFKDCCFFNIETI